jgi:hypothetical protein
MKRLQYFVLTVLTIFVAYRGILPAMHEISTDFPNYYTSARVLIDGKDVGLLYDDNWFQGQIYSYGMHQLGKFSPYPPVTAIIMTPIAFFAPIDALRIWTVLNVGVLAIGILLLSDISNRPWIWSALLFVLSGHALINNFKFGQFYLVLTVLILAGYRYWSRGEQTKGGFLLGLGATVKYFPLIFILQFLARKEWKIALAGVCTIALATAMSLIILGANVHVQFLSSILGPHLAGDIQNPFSSTFQSWNSLFRRLFIYDPVQNPQSLLNSSALYTMCLCCIYGIVLSALVLSFWRSSFQSRAMPKELQFSLLGIAGLLLLPASATYHYLLLILPVGILLNSSKWTLPQKTLAVLYVLIGFVPYSLFAHFETAGILAVLAYPRLLLMTGLFAMGIAITWKRPSDFSGFTAIEGQQQ